MDKWKESEVEKMKVGGNKKMKLFLDERDGSSGPIRTKYNTKAASLYKDKVFGRSISELNTLISYSPGPDCINAKNFFFTLTTDFSGISRGKLERK